MDNSKEIVTIIYSGHQIDYLYGLLSGLNSEDDFSYEVIDARRDDPERINFPNIKIYEFLDYRSIVKKSYIRFVISWSTYYFKLIYYLFSSPTKIIHIEWINRYFSFFEEIFLSYLYKISGKKIIFKVHDIDSNILLNQDGIYKLKLKYSKRIFYKRVNLFIVHNNYVKGILESYGINPKLIEVIPLGINNYIPISPISKVTARNMFNIPQKAKVVLFFGNISPYKNIETLIESFNDISQNDPNIFLIIAGGFKRGLGKYKDKIMDLINSSQHKERILLHMNFIPANEVSKFFLASDILCLPYKFIFQSAVVLLSYAAGIPVVAKNIGGISEDVLNNKTGLLYNTDEELKETLSLAFIHTGLYRDALLINYAKEKYSWEAIGKDTIGCYKRVLNEDR